MNNNLLIVDYKTNNKDVNKDLFEFALEELPFAGWKIVRKTFDLHHDAEMMEGNVMTEYEEKFSSKGNPICKYIIKR